MIVGAEQTPVCESANIIAYMDEQFEGKSKLTPTDEQQKARYQELYDKHEGWHVENYSLSKMMEKVYLAGSILPYRLS